MKRPARTADRAGGGWLGGPVVPASLNLRQMGLLTVGISIVTNLLALVQPVFMLHVYDFVLPSQSLSTLAFLTAIALFLLVVMGALEYYRSRIFNDIGWVLDEWLRPVSLRAAYEAARNGSRLGRSAFLADIEAIKGFITGGGPPAFLDLPWTLVFIVALFFLSAPLGYLSLAFAVIVLVAAIINEVSLRRLLAEAAKSNADSTQMAEDMLQAVDAIEAMRFRPAALERWQAEARRHAGLTYAAANRNYISTAFVRTLRMWLQVALLAAAAWLVLQGSLSGGAMIAASIIGARALAPIDQAVSSWRAIAAGRTAWQRIGVLLASPVLSRPEPTAPPPLRGEVAVRDLAVASEAGTPIIYGTTLSVVPGTFLALTGPSGSGKSTLARAIVGAVPPARGQAMIDGVDLANWPDAMLAAGVGYMPQDVQLMAGTFAENIRRLGPRDDAGVVETAAWLGIHSWLSGFPEGYETRISEGGRNLSGGQRALVGLARALYGFPALVVLDEPSAHLDREGRLILDRALKGLRQRGSTVIVISHDLTLLRACDAVAVMRAGTLAQFGPVQDVLRAAAPQAAATQAATQAAAADQGAGEGTAGATAAGPGRILVRVPAPGESS